MSLKEAEARLSDLETTIESTAAASGRLNTEIANEAADLEKGEKALAQLTSMREKQAKEFNEEEKDMIQSIQALDSAIVVLSKHHGGAEAQAALATISHVIQAQMKQHQALLQGAITPHQRRVVLGALLQEDDKQPAAKFRAYQPQSSEIFGILRQMKETFEGNLADSQKEELGNGKAYEEQKSAKGDEIKAIKASLNNKRTQLAKADETNAQSKEDYQDTQDSLSIDDTFLQDLKVRCAATDEEWALRQKQRQEEITAIVQAISILSQDEARDTFSKTFNPAASFLQRASRRSRNAHAGARRQAVALLNAAAKKSGNPELSGLAMAAQLDAFTKVKEAIDKMVTELTAEQKKEVQDKDYCNDKLNENTLLSEAEVRKKADTESKIAGFEQSIKELTEAIKTLNTEIGEMNTQIKRAGEDRELINKEFQSTIADQRETQKLLNKAMTVLKAVYAKQEAAAKTTLLRENAEVYSFDTATPPPPPAGFKAYNKNSGGGGVVALLTQIIGDAKVLEAQAVKDEQNAQETYEKMIKDTNDSINSKNKAITNKSEDKAKGEQDLTNSKTDLDSQTKQLTSLQNTMGDLNIQCDFLLRNFDVRQQARDEEIEALRQAKAILSGMQVDDA